MSIGTKLGAAVAAVALALVGYRLVQPEAAVHEPDAAAVSPAIAAAEVAPGSDAPQAGADPARVTLAERSAPREPQGAPDTRAAARPLAVTARLVDEDLSPLADAVLRIGALESESVPTGPDGVARVELPAGAHGRIEYEVACAGFVTRAASIALEPGADADLGRIVLGRAGRIRGIVVDERGLPLAGADVVVSPRMSSITEIELLRRVGPDRFRGVLELTSGPDGRFVADGVTADEVRVWAGAPGRLWTASSWLAPRSGVPAEEVRVQLEPAADDEVLRGLVLAPDGRPVEACTVRADYRGPATYLTRWAQTGEDGRFQVLGVRAARTDFRATDPEGRWSDAVASGASAAGETVLRFREPRIVTLLAQDARQAPLEGVSIRAVARFERDSQAVGRAVAREGEPGAYVLREPAEPFTLEVHLDGHADHRTEHFAPGELPDPFVVTLAELPGIHGRVTIEGRPVRGARVQLAQEIARVGDAFQAVHHRGFLTELDPYADFGATTDPQGRFSFAPQEAGGYAVRAEVDGLAPAEVRLPDYDPTVGVRGVELALTGGGRIEGRVIPRDGGDPLGMQVAASRGDGHVLAQHVGSDGAFAFEHLIPGRWMVEAVADDLDGLPTSHSFARERPELPWVCEVREGATTRHDIDLSGLEPCSLAGRFSVDGEPAAGWTAALRGQFGNSQRPSENPRATLDAHGAFELSVPKPGPYALLVESGGAGSLVLEAGFELEPGRRDWELEIETGSVVIEGIPATGAAHEFLYLEWTHPSGTATRKRLQPDPAGRATVGLFPAGPLHVRRYPSGSWNPEIKETLLSTRLLPGQTLHLRVP